LVKLGSNGVSPKFDCHGEAPNGLALVVSFWKPTALKWFKSVASLSTVPPEAGGVPNMPVGGSIRLQNSARESIRLEDAVVLSPFPRRADGPVSVNTGALPAGFEGGSTTRVSPLESCERFQLDCV
jgi:hypothetical protein